jgi:hypothetical protein
MPPASSFEEYVGSLGRLSVHVDPTATTPEAIAIKSRAAALAALPEITTDALSEWAKSDPDGAQVLGLVVGLSREKLRNVLRHHFQTSSWAKVARTEPAALIATLDSEFGLVRSLVTQRHRAYEFGDILVARASSRTTATTASTAGRGAEDRIEAIAGELGLPYETRTRFIGRATRTAPCDLAIPSGQAAAIVVAAKAFDSTGSKLTDAVREIEEMADVRLPHQFVLALVDGIGWKRRMADLRRIHGLWERQLIDGLYTLATLDRFRADIETAARLRSLI